MTSPSSPSAETLAPCPMCGSHLEKSEVFSNRTATTFVHSDNDCILRGIIIEVSDREKDSDRVAAWNRRALPAPTQIKAGETPRLTYGQKLIAEAIEAHFGERTEDYDEDVDDTSNHYAWEAFDAALSPKPGETGEALAGATRHGLSHGLLRAGIRSAHNADGSPTELSTALQTWHDELEAALSAPPKGNAEGVKLGYTNWRGEYAVRELTPQSLWFGSTEWHPEPQWLIKAHDVEKNAERDFALTGFGLTPSPISGEVAALPIGWVHPGYAEKLRNIGRIYVYADHPAPSRYSFVPLFATQPTQPEGDGR